MGGTGKLYLNTGNISYNYAGNASQSGKGNGAGISCASGTNITMSGGTIDGNNAYSKGGGVYLKSAAFTMSGGTIGDGSKNEPAKSDTGKYSNKASSGAGIYADESSSLTINNSSCKINYNYASNGGGIYWNGSTLSVTDGNISYNGCTSCGGGIYFAAGATLNKVTFTKNQAKSKGGAFYIDGSKTVTVSGAAAFTENSTTSTSNYTGGGAVFIETGCSLNVTGSATFTKNQAGAYGGAIYNYGTLTLSNGTFTGNKATGATGKGGAIYQQGTLNMSGAPYMKDDDHSEKINDIYLPSGKKISVTDKITSIYAGYITPASWPTYGSTVSVLEGSASALSYSYDKFWSSIDGHMFDDSGNMH